MDLTVCPTDQAKLRKDQLPKNKKGRGKGKQGKNKKSPKSTTKKGPKKGKGKGASKVDPKKKHNGEKADQVETVETKEGLDQKPKLKRSRGIQSTKLKSPKESLQCANKTTYGCSRCRWAEKGCTTCKNPSFKPRGKRNQNSNESDAKHRGRSHKGVDVD